MQRYWRTPGGQYYSLFLDMAAQPHLLIAGATGSGKSVLVNGIIATLLYRSPSSVQLILLDPKRTELTRYANLPHTLSYSYTSDGMLEALKCTRDLVDRRFSEMQKAGDKMYNGSDVYVIIDELAALMTTQKKAVLPILQYLGMVARAARVHMIACTQTVKADVLPTPLTCNFDSRVALRTSTAQQSRMIIDRAGCETFPSPQTANEAHCFYRQGADVGRWIVPYVSDSDIDALCQWWTSKKCIA